MSLITRVKTNRLAYDAIRRAPWLYGKLKARLAKLEQASLEERRTFTEEHFDQLLRHAAEHTTYGRGRVGRAAWPILEKERLRSHEREFLGAPRWLTCRGQTSGTTGIPLTVYRSLSSLVVEQIVYDRMFEARGLAPRTMRTAILRGDHSKPLSDLDPPYGRLREGGRNLVFSSNHLATKSVRHYVDELRAFRPQVLFAYPSSLHSLCALMEMQGLSLEIPLAVTSSEVLNADTIALARRILGCASVDYYGQAERVSFAMAMDGGPYRFVPGYAAVELPFSHRDGDEDFYEVVGTGLWNTAMPLVRFRTGDLIATTVGLSADALEEIRYGVRGFARIVGRKEGAYLDAPDGGRIVGMTHLMAGVSTVYQWQIIQEAIDQVRILVIPKSGFSAGDERKILGNARYKFPVSVNVRVHVTDRLERAPSGKTPFVIKKRAA